MLTNSMIAFTMLLASIERCHGHDVKTFVSKSER